jgi:hypothetical protein
MDVVLFAVAVVPDVQRGAAGEAVDRAFGLVVVGDVDPEGRAAVAGVPEVEVDGLLVIGEGRDDATRQALLRGVARVVVEDLRLVKILGFRSANPAARSAAAARSASPPSVRMATRKLVG